MKKTKVKLKPEPDLEITEIKPDIVVKKLEGAIRLLYEKVANQTGKSLTELNQATLEIHNGVVTVKEVKHE